MNVAFLGLGTMGAPMAANLRRAGHALVVWNRTRARADAFAREHAGVTVADTPADAARGAEVVITMLADPPALRAVVAGERGVLDGLGAGALLVDMSTVDPATLAALAPAVRARGAALVDAPVSGTRRPAAEGRLLVMAGGDAADVARARPLLECLGEVRHVGGAGAGSALKLVLNGLGAHMMTGFAAAMVLAVKQGVDARVALDAIQSGAFSSPLYAGKAPRMLARDFAPDFTVELMLKDQRLVLATAAALGYPMPTLERIREVLEQAVAAGLGGDDLSGVVQLFERWAGVTVR